MRDEPADGPFRGVPIAIKDLTDVAGMRTTYSCRGLADNVAAADSALVRRVRAAGFVVVGKTNTPEFGSTAVTESNPISSARNARSRMLTQRAVRPSPNTSPIGRTRPISTGRIEPPGQRVRRV